ncbi:MAG: CopG family transcriptional regulator [Chloroflexota bacterium]
MRKTTIYLADEEAEQLRHVSTETGKSQSALLREALHYVLSLDISTHDVHRTFHSMGVGCGTGEPYREWDAEDLYRESMG